MAFTQFIASKIITIFSNGGKMRFRVFILTVFFIMITAFGASAQVPYDYEPNWFSVEDSDYGTGCSFGDINMDGFLDFAVSNGNDMALSHNYVYMNNNGALSNSASWISDNAEYSGHCELGDINADGFPELAVSNYVSSGWGPGNIELYNNINGWLENSPSWVCDEPVYSFRCAFGDADGDGDLDLAVATGESYNGIYEENLIFYNIGGVLETTPSWRSADSDASYDVQWVDIDNDGDLDLAFLPSGDPVKIYYNYGDSIGTTPGWVADYSDNGNSFDFADINGDGWFDLGVAYNQQQNGSGNYVIYYSDNGVLHTTPDWTSMSFGYGSAAVFSDVDNDGDYDFIGGRWWGVIFVYLNSGGTYDRVASWGSSHTYESVIENIEFADVDNRMETPCLETFVGDGSRKLFYLNDKHIQGIDSLVVDGIVYPKTKYCYQLEDGWVSLKFAPSDYVNIYYRNSPYKDMAISNWDTASFIFSNTKPAAEVLVDMAPANPPVKIIGGDSFVYSASLRNNTAENQTVDVWIMLNVPEYGLYGPIKQYNNISLNPYQTLTAEAINQYVPTYAPNGTYKYIADCGEYPDNIIHADTFNFTVVDSGSGEAKNWSSSPWFEKSVAEVPPSPKMLINNYPNPFNATTTISYILCEDSDVRLDIYNLAGQKVSTLVDNYSKAGSHTAVWNAGNFSSGIYLYRLKTGNNVLTGQMTLLK